MQVATKQPPLGWEYDDEGTLVPDIDWRVINDLIAVEGRTIRASKVSGFDEEEEVWDHFWCDPPVLLRIGLANDHELHGDLLRDMGHCVDPYYAVDVLEPSHPGLKGLIGIEVYGWTIMKKTGEVEMDVDWEVVDDV